MKQKPVASEEKRTWPPGTQSIYSNCLIFNAFALSKAEMKKVTGGVVAKDLCVMTVTYANGQTGSGDYWTGDANALCVHWIETHQVASCGYDCAADGFGQ